jgi:D-alanyl-lipoteichoic acid acyltransferase DltB (MBOAT superfamily)
MNYLFKWQYWAIVLGAYIVMQFLRGRIRALVFGAISLTSLYCLAGISVAAFAVFFSLISWLTAWGLARQRQKISYFIGLVGIAVILTLYKVLLRHPDLLSAFSNEGSFGHFLFQSLISLGFAYSGLRLYDFLRAIKFGSELLDPLSLCGYLFPLHMIIAGPICLYKDYLAIQDQKPSVDYVDFVKCINIIVTGLFYKVVIAESIRIVGWGLHLHLTTDSLLETGILFIYLFFDFCGYSLVALGIGKLLGVPTPVNFKKPFSSYNITDFWTRWHVSLGDFVRQNIHIPIQVFLVRKYGTKRSEIIAFFSSIVSFIMVGLWHQFTINFMIWGFFLGLIMGVEKIARRQIKKISFYSDFNGSKIQSFLGALYVFIVITCSLHIIINDVL